MLIWMISRWITSWWLPRHNSSGWNFYFAYQSQRRYNTPYTSSVHGRPCCSDSHSIRYSSAKLIYSSSFLLMLFIMAKPSDLWYLTSSLSSQTKPSANNGCINAGNPINSCTASWNGWYWRVAAPHDEFVLGWRVQSGDSLSNFFVLKYYTKSMNFMLPMHKDRSFP